MLLGAFFSLPLPTHTGNFYIMSEDTKPVPQKPLNERIQDMFRELLPGVLTDEDIKNITERGIEEMFFKPRSRKVGGGWNAREEELPPLIEEIITKQLGTKIEAAALAYLEKHPEAVDKVLEMAVERGAMQTVFNVFSRLFANMFTNNLQTAKSTYQVADPEDFLQQLRNAGVNI